MTKGLFQVDNLLRLSISAEWLASVNGKFFEVVKDDAGEYQVWLGRFHCYLSK